MRRQIQPKKDRGLQTSGVEYCHSIQSRGRGIKRGGPWKGKGILDDPRLNIRQNLRTDDFPQNLLSGEGSKSKNQGKPEDLRATKDIEMPTVRKES